jgi:flavin-dependent dehydrogenase
MGPGLEGIDVVVIGGGPAGCYAAKTIAEHGVRTLIVEEHGAIGLPR